MEIIEFLELKKIINLVKFFFWNVPFDSSLCVTFYFVPDCNHFYELCFLCRENFTFSCIRQFFIKFFVMDDLSRIQFSTSII
jgi:hypothetical protein